MDLTTLDFHRPLLIAEIGGNHNGAVSAAYELARLAVEHGADVVKFQTYSGDGLVNPTLSQDRHAHFTRLQLGPDEWPRLAQYVRNLGATWMTSLWDPALFDVVAELQPAFKVGSGDLSNLPLLDRMARSGKPLILSTAMASLEEVGRVVDFLLDRDHALLADHRLGLLQCTAMYDAPDAPETHLAVMETLRRSFPGAVVGYSNHYIGLDAARAALALGAMILEVHFTTDRHQAMRDHRLSVLPEELAELRELCERIPQLRGDPTKRLLDVELPLVRDFRRAVYFRRDAEPGHVVSEEDLVALRPEAGIPAWNYYDLIGCRVARHIKALEPLSWDLFLPTPNDEPALMRT